MQIVCISDTHLRPMIEPVPDGDVLIHAGDATLGGTADEVESFLDRFSAYPHKYKIFVAGNHDWLFQTQASLARAMTLTSLIAYLQDSAVTIEGVKFYGSPWQPEFCNWAFNLPRGKPLQEKWAQIPDDTDVLVTHSPPKNILDANGHGEACGCEDLFNRVLEVKPKLHVFGHIHESYGKIEMNDTTFVNASICDGIYRAVNKPIVIEI